MNIYTGTYVRAADNEDGYEFLNLPKGYPQMHMPWLNILPESLYWGIRHISETLGRNDLAFKQFKIGVAELENEIENSISETVILCNASRLLSFQY